MTRGVVTLRYAAAQMEVEGYGSRFSDIVSTRSSVLYSFEVKHSGTLLVMLDKMQGSLLTERYYTYGPHAGGRNRTASVCLTDGPNPTQQRHSF